MKKFSACLLLAFLLVGACKQKEKSATVIENQPQPNPVDIPFKEYAVNTATGDTLVHPTGSVLVFPPNSFVDEAGNAITGNVQVKYREFTDPVDIFLAGIPMQYDSSGKTYQLASAGMMEILAFKDGKPVFVNQKSKPEIYLNSNNRGAGYSVYRLDTVQKNWINKGPMTIIETGGQAQSGNNPEISTDNAALPPPVKPLKADNKSPVMEILIDTNSFQEFAAYKGLKFQVDESKTPLNPRDSSEEWNNLELIKGNGKGNYLAKFSNVKKTATYAVKPVFEGEDYNQALKAFEKEKAAYEKKVKSRDKKARAQYYKDSLENRKVEEYNNKIDKLNAIIEKQRSAIKARNAAIEAQNFETVLRAFRIDGLGVWNCDLAISQDIIRFKAVFKDEQGNELRSQHIGIILKSYNTTMPASADNMFVVDKTDNMIIVVLGDKIGYVGFDEVKKLNITRGTKEVTFVLKFGSYLDVKKEYADNVIKR